MIKKLKHFYLNLGITYKLLLLNFFILSLFAVAIGIFSYFKTTSVMYGELTFWAERIASQISEKSVFGVVLEDSVFLEKNLDFLKSDTAVLKAQIFSKRGALLAQYGDLQFEPVFRLLEKVAFSVHREKGIPILLTEYPIFSQDVTKGKIVVGQVRLFYSLKRLENLIRNIFFQGAIVVFLTFTFAGILGFFFSKTQISDPARKTVNILSSSSQGISSLVMEFRAGTSEQASSVQELTTSSEEIASAAKQIAEKASKVEHAARESFSIIENSLNEVKQLINEVYSIKKRFEDLASIILGMTDMSRKITGITGLIEDISERTNLLAVNAAIEAAGAGEAGKRFGVVASEIRNLATRTKEATNEIRRVVEEIQDTVSKTVMASETGVRSFDEVVRALGRFNTIFSEINKAASNALDLAQEITLSTRQQVASSEQMTEALSEVNEVAHGIAESAAKMEETSSKLVEAANFLSRII